MHGVAAQGFTVKGPAFRLPARIGAAAALLLTASCATAPQRSPVEWMGVLPGDATMYISVSVPQSAELIRKTLKEGGPAFNDVITLSDMTKRLLVSVTMAKGAPMRFAAVALGGYPSLLIGMSLSGKKEWKQVSLPEGSFYLWNKANLQLSVPNRSILLAANGDMPTLLSRYKIPVPLPIPPEVASDMAKTDIVLYMPQLPGGVGEANVDQPAVAESDERPHLPIREVWVDAMKTKDGYLLGATMNTGTEKQARVLSLMVRIGIVAWMKANNVPQAGERLRAISVVPEGTSVMVKGIAVRDGEIMPLILTLLNGAPADAGNASPAPAAGQGAPAAGQGN